MLNKTLVALLVVAALPAGVAMAQTKDLGQTTLGQSGAVVVDVAKNAGCMCCEGWITRMKDDGFEVHANNISNEELYKLKISRGITEDLMSCHTATIGKYTVEEIGRAHV